LSFFSMASLTRLAMILNFSPIINIFPALLSDYEGRFKVLRESPLIKL
jgi:hypothetical protein